MQTLVDFLINYWQYIGIGLIMILDLIILIVKKNKTYDNSILSEVLPLVIQAESLFGSGEGSKKLEYVLNSFNYIAHPSVSRKYISDLVELLLCVPTKKGGYGREE